MRKAAVTLLAMFGFVQLWVLGWSALIVITVLERPTLFGVVAGVLFLVTAGVLVWMAQQMKQDVKRWNGQEHDG